MPSGVGVVILPTPVVNSADQPTGLASIPMFVVSGIGYNVAGNITLPKISVLGIGTVNRIINLIELPVPTVSSVGYAGILGAGSIVIPVPVVSSFQGISGTGVCVLPMFVVSQILPGRGIGSIMIPMFEVACYGSIDTTTYLGVVMNIVNQAISTYSGFPFNSLAYFNGRYIGASASGIYTMSGNLLNGSLIKSNIKTGTIDLGATFIRYISDIWITYRSDGKVAVVIEADEKDNTNTEMRSQISSRLMHEERLGAGTGGVPKGLRGKFYEIEFKNVDGSDFDLDMISIMVEAIRRKIR